MTQTRTDVQLKQLLGSVAISKHFRGERPTIRVHLEEIVCTTEEVEGTASDLLSLRAAVRRVIEALRSEREEGSLASWQVLRFVEDALRAEMAGIDKDEGGAS